MGDRFPIHKMRQHSMFPLQKKMFYWESNHSERYNSISSITVNRLICSLTSFVLRLEIYTESQILGASS